jgi:hypothetical protein
MTTVITRDANNDGENNNTNRLTVRALCRRATGFIYLICVGLSRRVKKNE